MLPVQELALGFGLLAGLLWLLSSAAWIWAAKVKLDLGKPVPGREEEIGGLSITVDDSGRGEFVVNGMNVPSFRQILDYQREQFKRNAIAAGLGALGALAACGAAYFAFLA